MLKMYDAQSHGGDSPDFWEENWEASNFEESLRFCSVDPLRPLFEKYSSQQSLMLEGGCGLGQYLAYYKTKGLRVVGVDFAQHALKVLLGRRPDLDVCGGDVSNLPFADGTFDLYYSGGVVEHFEGGAEKALAEAGRVIKDDGVLLISVPYESPLRRILSPFRRKNWKRKIAPVVDPDDESGLKFFQYVYRPAEFETMLRNAGLKVVERQGYAVLWGLAELPFVGISPDIGEKSNRRNSGPVDIDELVRDRPISLLKRLVVSEDSSVPVLGLGVRLMRWWSANMMMYVCKKAK